MDINMICAGCMHPNTDGGDCPVCGLSPDYQNDAAYLPVRFVLFGRYIVGKVLSSSCESVIYIAYDNEKGKTVNIKEYFPTGIAERLADKSVTAAENREKAFSDGSEKFKELNGKLIKIDLPALPKTRAIFGTNGTMYVVTDAIMGLTLKDFLSRNENRLKWEQARPLFLPLIDTVNELNKQGIIHGGISPESIFIGRDGTLQIRDILINTARCANKEMAAQIYGGYAAIEQYKPSVAELDGYTDVYGISATLFRTLIGAVPSESVKRFENDDLSIPSHFANELPRQVLVAMANGLQVLPENRTSTVERFRDELVYGEIDEDEEPAPSKKERKKAEKKQEKEKKKQETAPKEEELKAEAPQKKNSALKIGLITAGVTVVVVLAVAAALIFGVFKDKLFDKKTESSRPPESEMPSVASIGDYDSEVVEAEKTYAVPDVLGKIYSSVTESEENKVFKFSVAGKEYSSKYARGTICSQSVEAGKQVTEGTAISVKISLGPQEYAITDVTGATEAEAKIQLLRQGILFDNIEVVERYDSDKKSGIVLEQSPKAGTTVSDETRVRIYVNSYTGDDDDN